MNEWVHAHRNEGTERDQRQLKSVLTGAGVMSSAESPYMRLGT